MKENKIKLYLFDVILLTILFVALLVSNNMTQAVLATILFLFALFVKKGFTRPQKASLYAKEIMFLLLGFGIIYVGAFYLLGFIFYTFSKQIVPFGMKSILENIIPLAITIVSSEIIRNVLINQNGSIKIGHKKIDFAKVLTFINMVLIDLIVYRSVYNLDTLNGLLSLVGFILCASISCNLFYNYTSKRYGYKGIIAYRLITSLYVYFIPVIPNMYIYFRSFIRMTVPYIMYLIIDYSYVKDKYAVAFKDKRNSMIKIAAILVVTALVTMLISCQFRYGIIVIGSGSMTGAIDYGDAAIFESYHGQRIEIGDVLVFKKDDLKIIHRVVEIQKVNGSIRYYTKGDYNDYVDVDYRTASDLLGVYKFRIKYIGYPTLFVNDLFK